MISWSLTSFTAPTTWPWCCQAALFSAQEPSCRAAHPAPADALPTQSRNYVFCLVELHQAPVVLIHQLVQVPLYASPELEDFCLTPSNWQHLRVHFLQVIVKGSKENKSWGRPWDVCIWDRPWDIYIWDRPWLYLGLTLAVLHLPPVSRQDVEPPNSVSHKILVPRDSAMDGKTNKWVKIQLCDQIPFGEPC